jgi:2'-5' RNA ligase
MSARGRVRPPGRGAIGTIAGVPRVRLGVVLLIPPPWSTEIDGLRRACGDRRRERIAPHVTLVPPLNVRGEHVGAALAVLREAAATRTAAGPLVLEIGPPGLFHPDSATLHLRVTGPGDELPTLRAAVFRPPLERPLDWPFAPHVTLAEEIPEDRARAALTALDGYRVTVPVDRIHLLQERAEVTPDGVRRRWVPTADAPFARPAVVGRGGVELELHRSQLVDPEGVTLAGQQRAPAGAVPVVVSARRWGTLVGVARGFVRDDDHELSAIVVTEARRGEGIGRQLRLAFESAVAEMTADG